MSCLRTAIMTVVHPGALDFLAQFLHSLSVQTDRDFTTCLINDGVDGLSGILGQNRFRAEVINAGGGISANRRQGIEWIKNMGFEAIIFADADDIFAANRVAVCRQALAHGSPIMAHEVIPFTGDPAEGRGDPWLGRRLAHGQRFDKEMIRHGNCLGLGNTAIRCDGLPPGETPMPDSSIAFDWDFFAWLMKDGAECTFRDDTATLYRQHQSNLAGVGRLGDAEIVRAVEVKAAHYRFCAGFEPGDEALAAGFEDLARRLDDDDFRATYCRAVRDAYTPDMFWWEQAKLPEELAPWQ